MLSDAVSATGPQSAGRLSLAVSPLTHILRLPWA